jgi:hypothetical protein
MVLTICLSSFSLAFNNGGLMANPGVGLIENLGDQQQVVPTEVIGFSPYVTITKQASQCDVVPISGSWSGCAKCSP